MNPLHFDEEEYQRGHAAVSERLLEGLQANIAEGRGGAKAGSYLIGAYCAVIALVWKNRRPDLSAAQIAANLSNVVDDCVEELASADLVQQEKPA